jgi:hypothetical protein
LIDTEAKAIIDEVHDRAKSLLNEKKDLLEELSQLLLDREVLSAKDIEEVLGPRPFQRPEHDFGGDGAADTPAAETTSSEATPSPDQLEELTS